MRHKVKHERQVTLAVEDFTVYKETMYFKTHKEAMDCISKLHQRYYRKLISKEIVYISHYVKKWGIFWVRKRREVITWWDGGYESNRIIDVEDQTWREG